MLEQPSAKLNQSIGNLNLWQNTGATVIGILHNEDLIVSPGPYAVIETGDTLYFVGNDTSYQAVQHFFYQ